MASLTSAINREISVYINRKGKITAINVGDSGTVSLPETDGRRGNARLSGIRCIHTHPNGDGRLSAVDLNSLLKLSFDAMASVGVRDGKITNVYVAIPELDESGERTKSSVYGPFYRGQNVNGLFELVNETERHAAKTVQTRRDDRERAILVGLETDAGRLINGKSEGERSLEELKDLAATAGLEVIETVLQRKQAKDPAYYIGKGKVKELHLLGQAANIDTLVFDDELSGAQIRNIERETGFKVIDRTMLILDIFAQRARSSEGKLQVELAQLKYRLPRLMGMGGQLSRLGGGIGTRGPGEKQLEVDRRHIRKRIGSLEKELEQLGKRREQLRESRKKNLFPVVALVGYTNSGKSTLLNRLCNAGVLAEDKLFATLDPTTRKLVIPDGTPALLVDTVGFIRKLPHELIEAFKSTLEEAVYADLLIHVVDASDEEAEEHIAVVNELLLSLNAYNKPTILALNKMDIARGDIRLKTNERYVKKVEISALNGTGIEELLKAISVLVKKDEIETEILVPFDEGGALPYIHEWATIIEKNYSDKGLKMKIKIDKDKFERIKQFVL